MKKKLIASSVLSSLVLSNPMTSNSMSKPFNTGTLSVVFFATNNAEQINRDLGNSSNRRKIILKNSSKKYSQKNKISKIKQ